MCGLRSITFLLSMIAFLTVKIVKTQRTITATVVLTIITATQNINTNIMLTTALTTTPTPTTTTTTSPTTNVIRIGNNTNNTLIKTPTYLPDSITTITTTTTATTLQYENSTSNILKNHRENSEKNTSTNSRVNANINMNEHANDTFLSGTYQIYTQQEQQPIAIKKFINSKGFKLPLAILSKQQHHQQQQDHQQQQQQQQQNSILSIAQTIQKPLQNWFNIFNRNQASLSSSSTVENITTTMHTMAHNTTLYTCSCRCGERNDEIRIVGGSTTSSNEYPWMARLSYFNRFYCGGTLINDRYVLSAAHCIKGFMWFMIKVTFGEHDRCKIKDRPETRFVLRAFTQKFSFANFDNDIALLRLNDRVPITNFIKPICLPKIKDRDNQFVGTDAIVTGWGTLKEDGKASCVLQEVVVPVLDNHVCVVQTNYTQKMITKNMMCAGYPGKGEKDSCQGDSGGPLIRMRSSDKRYEQIGIVSWGNGCARPNYPGVYTRVTKYLDWIIENSKDGCFCED